MIKSRKQIFNGNKNTPSLLNNTPPKFTKSYRKLNSPHSLKPKNKNKIFDLRKGENSNKAMKNCKFNSRRIEPS